MKSKFAIRLRVLGALGIIAIILAACGGTAGTTIRYHIHIRRYTRTGRELQARCFADLQQHRLLD